MTPKLLAEVTVMTEIGKAGRSLKGGGENELS